MKSDKVTIFIPGIVKKEFNIDSVRRVSFEEFREDISDDFEFLYILEPNKIACGVGTYFIKYEGQAYNTGTKIREE